MIFLLVISILLAFAINYYYGNATDIEGSFSRIPDFEVSESYQPITSITIIVAARNEEKNIEACLRSLVSQQYPKELLEIIIVDDWSEDKTTETVEAYQQGYPDINLKLVKLSEVSPEITSKKAAISCAVTQASGQLIVTTDADCEAHFLWLQTIAAFYEQEKPKMILGPVDFVHKNSRFAQMQNLEFLGLMATTAVFANKNKPIMCNGANLAYEREAFNEVNGFADNNNIPSGDDVFLMLKIAEKYPNSIKFLKSREAIVLTQPQETVKDFFNQRKRWLSKRPGYKNKILIKTAFAVYIANLACIISLVTALVSFSVFAWFIVLIIWPFKILRDYSLLHSVTKWFKKDQLMKWFFIEEPLVILYVVLIGIFGNSGKYLWKGRKIKPSKIE